MELKEKLIYTLTIIIMTACLVLILKSLLVHQYVNIIIYMAIMFLAEIFTMLKYVKVPNINTENITETANLYYMIIVAVITGIIFILLEVSKNIVLSVLLIIAVIAGVIYTLLHLDTIVNITEGIRDKTVKPVENFEEEEFNSAEMQDRDIIDGNSLLCANIDMQALGGQDNNININDSLFPEEPEEPLF